MAVKGDRCLGVHYITMSICNPISINQCEDRAFIAFISPGDDLSEGI